jgi:hypothetical protein
MSSIAQQDVDQTNSLSKHTTRTHKSIHEPDFERGEMKRNSHTWKKVHMLVLMIRIGWRNEEDESEKNGEKEREIVESEVFCSRPAMTRSLIH